MADKYEIQSTSPDSALVNQIVLGSKRHTRTILLAEEVNNPNDPDACIKAHLFHQRKRVEEEWENLPADSLSKLKAGGTARFTLDTARALKLLRHLSQLYEAKRQAGIPHGKKTLVVGSEDEIVRAPIERISLLRELAKSPGDLWQALEDTHPGILRQLTYSKLHEERATALAQFKAFLNNDESEDWWQNFFIRTPGSSVTV